MQDLKTLKRMIHQLLAILDRGQRRRMIRVLVILTAGALFELLGVTAILPFVQALLSPENFANKPFIANIMRILRIHETRDIVMVTGIGIIMVYLLKNAFLAFSARVQTWYANDTYKDLSVAMLRSYMERPYSFFTESGSGPIVRGVNTDTMGVYNMIFVGFKFISEALVILSISVYLLIADVYLALGTLFVGILCMLIIIFAVKKLIAHYARITRESDARRYQWMLQSINGIRDIKVFQKKEYFTGKFEYESELYTKANSDYSFLGLLPERLIEAFCVSGIILTVLIRYRQGVDAVIFVPKLATFAMGAFRMLPSISRITGHINNMIYYRPMVEATYENITKAREYQAQGGTPVYEKESGKERTFFDAVTIKDITWQYDGGREKVLKGLSLTIRSGETVGIIGESGSGKSTLADILLMLYEPQGGQILMDGTDIRAIPDVWHHVISYVPQNVFLLDDTIRTNVAFGEVEADEKRVWDALNEASLFDYVKELPKGLDTLVGEQGVKLSGGQRQRIAIARALYFEPQILILDEATSALDNETEEAVMEAIEALSGSMTMSYNSASNQTLIS